MLKKNPRGGGGGVRGGGVWERNQLVSFFPHPPVKMLCGNDKFFQLFKCGWDAGRGGWGERNQLVSFFPRPTSLQSRCFAVIINCSSNLNYYM